MILFTGHGDIASAYSAKFPCKIISSRGILDDELKELLSSCSAVIHNSANLNPKNLSEAVNDNFFLTKRLIDYLDAVNPSARFVYISSMSILKNHVEYEDPLLMNNYALSKYLGEIYTLSSSLPDKVSIRFSTIFYGNPQKDGLSLMINDAVKKQHVRIINNGVARRDFIPLDILIEYLHRIVMQKKLKTVYTFSGGQSYSFADILSIIKKELPQVEVTNDFMENTVTVLSDFPRAHQSEINQIEFSISDYIKNYISTLLSEKLEVDK